MSRRYPRVQVDANVLYVDDGDIMTSAGRAAGLDLCLHIVRSDHGTEIANQVARRLVIAPHREGGQAQYIRQPVPSIEGDALAIVFDWAQRHLDRDLTISSLAAKARMSRRTFIRRFEDATGMSPGEWVVQTRVAKARELLEATPDPDRRRRDRDRLWLRRCHAASFQAAARHQPGALPGCLPRAGQLGILYRHLHHRPRIPHRPSPGLDQRDEALHHLVEQRRLLQIEHMA